MLKLGKSSVREPFRSRAHFTLLETTAARGVGGRLKVSWGKGLRKALISVTTHDASREKRVRIVKPNKREESGMRKSIEKKSKTNKRAILSDGLILLSSFSERSRSGVKQNVTTFNLMMRKSSKRLNKKE